MFDRPLHDLLASLQYVKKNGNPMEKVSLFSTINVVYQRARHLVKTGFESALTKSDILPANLQQVINMGLNKHIIDYLDYYVSLKTPPNFAVLIRGKWGSGKSWFIKKYIEKYSNDKSTKFLYVSLNGISTISEVEDFFFLELNPVFKRKDVKLATTLIKGLLKLNTKIDFDLNGDGKSEGSTSGTLPDIPLLTSFKELKNCVLIFDDLERCTIPVQNRLGYITQFVENKDFKVIILANEDEIEKPEKESTRAEKSYWLIKEKLIGRSFDIASDIDQAITDFIGQLQDQGVQTLLTKHRTQLKRTYETANYNNLRHLRQSILDFERFCLLLPPDCLEKEDLVNSILQTYLAISIEIKKGELKEEDIEELFKGPFVRKLANENPLKIIYLKYSTFDQLNKAITPKNWFDYFKKGVISQDELEESIYNSIYYQDINTPYWKKLSNFYYLTQPQFDELIETAYEHLNNFTIHSVKELVEVVALFLFFSRNKILDQSQESIAKIALENIDNLQNRGVLTNSVNSSSYFPERHLGLDDQLYESDEFKAFFKQLHAQINKNRTEVLKKAATELLQSLHQSAQEFDEKLLIDRYGMSRYSDTPILKYIDVSAFVHAFWQLAPTERYSLGHTLKDRYRHDDFNKKLGDELQWLKDVKEQITKENRENNDKLTQYLIETKIVELLTFAIDSLEQSNTVSTH